MNNVVSLETTPSDADLAKQYRERMQALLTPVAVLLNEASKNGLEIAFTCVRNNYGRHEVGHINVIKLL